MSRRWRPSLALVLGGALTGTLALSLAGMITLRYLGPVIGYRHAALVISMVIALATAGLGWLMLRLLLRPIRALEHFAAEVEQGQELAPPTHFGTHELHSTARRVITMAGALRDRETTVRAYTDHVTHELKTPVAAIRAAAELLGEAPLSPADHALLGQIDGARQQIEAQLSALREMARARETRYLGSSALTDVLPLLQADWLDLRLEISREDIRFAIAPEGLRLILSHLARNAREHGASRLMLAAGAEGWLLVADNGRGISPGNAGRVFDPFFTTRREAGGTGMGLSVVRAILSAHGGTIVLEPFPTGAAFRLALPLS